ncbi:hypothetical protein [Methylobacterium dankookense]|uniref:Uncharacterized protein n=1 Tax=Methylobacterium dankookense TaxID=560405 RepID=A0A564FTL3_9HYPH|nr:hypothetical protein [Methylobacterium dankookense]GJD58396.1 hypothetical protein IFDJLNFL_4315 [Methylobacterium dankookense]VUF11148.1 hypothetical protein MTDSW087_00821 [Methylobacterium dankookense]
MRAVIAIAVVALSALPAYAQSRRPMLCVEESAVGLGNGIDGEEAKPAVFIRQTFSLTVSGDYMTLISSGRSEFYECSAANPRLNEGRPRNTIKCQNGIYFITLDLGRNRFVRAQLNPEDRTAVRVSYGSCKPI